MVRTPSDPSVCPHCPKTFIRPEHLRRHIRSVHDEQGTNFRCGECDKSFNRADSCRRHEQSHHKHVQDGDVSCMSKAKAGERVRRACRNCARARTKCTGGSRCTRCRSKDLTCKYANKTNPLDGKLAVVGTHESHVEPVLQQEIQTPEVIVDPPTSTAAGEPVRSNHPDEAVVNAYDVPSSGLADLAQHSVDDNFNWNDINWLPVADNVDFSLLFGVGLDPAADEGWQSVPVNSQQPAHHAAPASSINSLEDHTAATGKASSLYADGFGGRRSLQTIPRSPVSLDEDNYDTPATHLQFPGRVALPLHASGFDGPGLDVTVYNSLTEHFHSLCTRHAGLGRAFSSVTFPSSAQLSRYLGLYLRHFDPDFPFIHVTTWSQHTAPWILVLAAATVGSSCDVGPDSFQTEAAFREFLRRAVRWNLDVEIDCDPLPLAQASLLHAIAQFGSNVPATPNAARHDFELAMELYETNVVLFPADEIDLSQGALKWQAWIAQEGHTRLMWSCWLVKALYTWLATPGGHVDLPDQLLVLPCDADLWDATNVESWVAKFPRTQPSVTLLSALQSLFVRHRVPSPIHTFSEVLLTYIVLGRADEVARTTQQPLHAWSPGPGDDQSHDEIQLPVSEPIWLPANPRYAAWRNSACGCFDVVHWKANADSTMARGSEGPLILHLHLVRLLLLCPYRSIISLATTLKKRSPTANRELPSAAQLDESILRWLTMDDHKGRLSLVHAGAIFWHLRRYARGHFYEPFSIFLSSLVIWVYGVYLPQVRGNLLHIKQMNGAERARRLQDSGGVGSSRRNSEEAEDDLTPKTILLDRPCDDEIVQVFVRRGYDMQADMSGAPDICLPNSQKMVLKEAVKVLRRPQHRHVGQSHTYRMVLQRLLQFS